MMELSQEQKDAIRHALNTKIGEHEVPNCEMCGHDEWAIGPYIVELREFAKGLLVGESAVIPVAFMHCKKCGNTKAFNAIVLEVVDKQTGEIKGSNDVETRRLEAMRKLDTERS